MNKKYTRRQWLLTLLLASGGLAACGDETNLTINSGATNTFTPTPIRATQNPTPINRLNNTPTATVVASGQLTLQDDASIFSPNDISELKKLVGQNYFDVKIITTDKYSSSTDFDNFIRSQTTSSPTALIIGISTSPKLKRTQVISGVKLEFPPSKNSAIAQATSAYFVQSRWKDGCIAAMQAAAS